MSFRSAGASSISAKLHTSFVPRWPQPITAARGPAPVATMTGADKKSVAAKAALAVPGDRRDGRPRICGVGANRLACASR